MPKIEMTKDDIAVSQLFNTKLGEQVLTYLKRMFFDDSVYVKGDPYHTAYQAGQQDVVGHILESIEIVKGDRQHEESD